MNRELIDKISNCADKNLQDLSEILMYSNEAEIDLLRIGYMGRCSKIINNNLRKRELSQNDSSMYEEIEKVINTTLERLENYSGKTVFRDEDRTLEYETYKAWFKENIGLIISYPSFLSSYRERYRMPDGHSLMLEIRTLHSDSGAYNLSSLKPKHPEQEVLFKSKTKFRIVSIHDQEKKVILEEVNQQPDITIYFEEAYYEGRWDSKQHDILI